MQHMADRAIFGSWTGVWHSVAFAAAGYFALAFMLRVTGKRTLAKMNIFDFVMVVALGSTLATAILSSEVSFVEGMAALIALIAMQNFLAWLTNLSHTLQRVINGVPALLFHRGEFLFDAMKRERVGEEEVRAAIRAHGFQAIEEVVAVVLETDGTFSVMRPSDVSSHSSLSDVRGHERFAQDEEDASAGRAELRGRSLVGSLKPVDERGSERENHH